jgi:hypothetical protein
MYICMYSIYMYINSDYLWKRHIHIYQCIYIYLYILYRDGDTPLFMAIFKHKNAMTKFLIEKGIVINIDVCTYI